MVHDRWDGVSAKIIPNWLRGRDGHGSIGCQRLGRSAAIAAWGAWRLLRRVGQNRGIRPRLRVLPADPTISATGETPFLLEIAPVVAVASAALASSQTVKSSSVALLAPRFRAPASAIAHAAIAAVASAKGQTGQTQAAKNDPPRPSDQTFHWRAFPARSIGSRRMHLEPVSP